MSIHSNLGNQTGLELPGLELNGSGQPSVTLPALNGLLQTGCYSANGGAGASFGRSLNGDYLLLPPVMEIMNDMPDSIVTGLRRLPIPMLAGNDANNSNQPVNVLSGFSLQGVDSVEGLQANQPLVGIIDTGFDVDHLNDEHSRIQLGRDRIDGDTNPLVENAMEHGTQVLNTILANDADAPLWLGRAVGSGQWAESLIEFVDLVKSSEHSNAVINLSFDLTQMDAAGNITTRYHLTPQEHLALNYAQQQGVLIVAAAGNEGAAMSALGQASQSFDNILTVGAADDTHRASYSSYGNGLDLLASDQADAGLPGTSLATANVTAAISQVWAANPELNYHQVIDILKATAIDLDTPGWDAETGSGLLNSADAIHLASITMPVSDATSEDASLAIVPGLAIETTALERPAWGIPNPVKAVKSVAKGVVNTATNVVSGAVDTVQDVATGAVNTAVDVATGVVDTVSDAASDVANTAGNVATDLANGDVIGAVQNLHEGVYDTAIGVVGNVAETAGNVADTVLDTTGNVADTAFDTAGNVVNTVLDTTGQVAGEVIDGSVQTVFDRVGDVAKDGLHGIGDGVNTVYDVAGDVADRVIDKSAGALQRGLYVLEKLPSRLVQFGEDLWEGMSSVEPWSADWWKSLIESKTWEDVGEWLGRVGIDIVDISGAAELAETLADLYKFNTRRLTDREIEVARSGFGDSINYDLVRIDEWAGSVPIAKWLDGADQNRPFTTFHTINTWKPMEDDTLIHELTHVWQYEQDGAAYIPEALGAQHGEGYGYGDITGLMDAVKHNDGLTHFNREQQGRIVQDYYIARSDSSPIHHQYLPLYAHFVKTVSTLSESTLSGTSEQGEYLVGDWDGDGKANLAEQRGNQVWVDDDFNHEADRVLTYGNGSSEDEYLVGDWNGDGRDTLAVRRGNEIWMDFDGDGNHDLIQAYGNGNGEDEYLVGDWDGDGRDNLAVRRGSDVLMDFNFDNSHDRTQTYGNGVLA